MINKELSEFCKSFPDTCIQCIINYKCQRYLNYNFHGFDRTEYLKEKRKMNIKESAKTYIKKETKNIVELEKIPINMEVFDKIGKEGTPEQYNYKCIEVKDEEYRVPYTVLEQLKAQLEANDKIGFFKVTKTGSGLETKYTVIILE